MRNRFRGMMHPRGWVPALMVLWVTCGSLPAAAPAPGFLSGNAAVSWQVFNGLQSGMIKEYVFIGDYLLSRLDWNIDLQPSLGTALHFRSGDWVFGFSVVIGIPAHVGWMKDYDWSEKDSSGFYNGVWTHYSEHDLVMDQAFRLELSGYLHLGGFFGGQVWLGASLGWQRYAMQGMDGFVEYPPGSERQYLSGKKVISYTTDQILPMIGVLSEWCFKSLSASLELRGSVIGFERAYDQHHERSLDFYDYFYFLPSLEIRASFGFAFSEAVRWYLTGIVVVFPETRGESYMTDLSVGKSYQLTSEGGASSWFAGIETGFQFMISE